MGDIIGITFENMDNAKTKLNKANVDNRNVNTKLLAAISNLQVVCLTSNLTQSQEAIRDQVSKVIKRIEDVDSVITQIDYAVTSFQEVDANYAAAIRGKIDEYTQKSNVIGLNSSFEGLIEAGGFVNFNAVNLLEMGDFNALDQGQGYNKYNEEDYKSVEGNFQEQIQNYYTWLNKPNYFNYRALISPGGLAWGAAGGTDVFNKYKLSNDQLFNYLKKEGLYIEKRGKYYIVHGRKTELKSAGNLGRKYSIENIEKYKNLSELVLENKTLSENLKDVFTIAKIGENGKLMKGPGILNYIAMGVDVGSDLTNDLTNKELKDNPTQLGNTMTADAVVDIGLDTANIAISTVAYTQAGAAIGTLIPVPIVGTLVGAVAGFAVGWGISQLTTGWKPFDGGTKSVSDKIKDGVKDGLNGVENQVGTTVNGTSKYINSTSGFPYNSTKVLGNPIIGEALFSGM